MYVGELIQALSKMPEDLEVVSMPNLETVVPRLCTGTVRSRVVLIPQRQEEVEEDVWATIKADCTRLKGAVA